MLEEDRGWKGGKKQWHTITLFRLPERPRETGLCGNIGTDPFIDFPFVRFGVEVCGWIVEGGVEEP